MTPFADVARPAERLSAQALAARLGSSSLLSDAQHKADRIIADARAEAAEIIKQAEGEIGPLRAALERQIDEQRAAMVEEFTTEVTALTAADSIDVAAILTDRFDALQPWLSDLILNALSRMIGTIDPDKAMRLALLQALKTARQDWSVRLLCSPGDEPMFRRLVDDAGTTADGGPFRGVSGIFADQRLQPGECLLESDGTVVDIGIRTQLDALRMAMARLHASDGLQPTSESARSA